jgi:hypothetical protein
MRLLVYVPAFAEEGDGGRVFSKNLSQEIICHPFGAWIDLVVLTPDLRPGLLSAAASRLIECSRPWLTPANADVIPARPRLATKVFLILLRRCAQNPGQQFSPR